MPNVTQKEIERVCLSRIVRELQQYTDPVGLRMAGVLSDGCNAGVPYKDNEDRFADFHALRMTYSTLLALAGVAERMRMELNRHSDARLTTHAYTDPSMLPLATAVSILPMLMDEGSDSQIDSQEIVPEGPDVSPAVTIEPGKVILLTSGDEVVRPVENTSVPQSPEPLESAPCRNRTFSHVAAAAALSDC